MKLPKKSEDQKERAGRILDALYHHYPDAHCELVHSNPFELLISTILSAQTTDEQVNSVTPKLFETWPTPEAMAAAPLEEIEKIIHSTGFYRQKAKSLKATAEILMRDFNGEVPQTMDELLTLRGAARKTANVVLGNAFGINEGVVVDTHVRRIANRLALTREKSNTERIERDLMALFPKESWTDLSHLLIFHGRNACKARFSDPPDHPVCIRFGKQCECRKMRGGGGEE